MVVSWWMVAFLHCETYRSIHRNFKRIPMTVFVLTGLFVTSRFYSLKFLMIYIIYYQYFNLQGQNDNAPVFTSSSYEVAVVENIALGTSIAR